MDLQLLLEPLLLKKIEGKIAGRISGLACHSKKAGPGTLFFALSGREEGWRYAGEAFQRGALAAVVEQKCPLEGYPLVRVPAVRPALALLANRYYGYPSRDFRLIGVTGTNGKTTTSHLIDALFRARGEVAGLLGTINNRIGEESRAATATTPEAHQLQEALADLSRLGATHVTLEVSSHALALDRVLGCSFDVAVLTNVTGEHLDFHSNFAAYLRAKARLFAHMGWSGGDEKAGPRAVVLNADSPYYHYFRRRICGQCISYGINSPAEVRAEQVQCGPEGISFRVASFAGSERFSLVLKGRFNVYNVLAAISVGLIEGFALAQIASILGSFPGVSGRFERVEAGQNYQVLVDYAHTPDGLASALQAARELAAGRIIAVFGCGGERDRSKRSLMGAAAGRHSDLAILTDDNPRNEDPGQIRAEVIPGLEQSPPAEGYLVIPDRREAIAAALEEAGSGDLVLIAGKGHECEQIYGGRRISFSDREVALELIREREGRKEKLNVD